MSIDVFDNRISKDQFRVTKKKRIGPNSVLVFSNRSSIFVLLYDFRQSNSNALVCGYRRTPLLVIDLYPEIA